MYCYLLHSFLAFSLTFFAFVPILTLAIVLFQVISRFRIILFGFALLSSFFVFFIFFKDV